MRRNILNLRRYALIFAVLATLAPGQLLWAESAILSPVPLLPTPNLDATIKCSEGSLSTHNDSVAHDFRINTKVATKDFSLKVSVVNTNKTLVTEDLEAQVMQLELVKDDPNLQCAQLQAVAQIDYGASPLALTNGSVIIDNIRHNQAVASARCRVVLSANNPSYDGMACSEDTFTIRPQHFTVKAFSADDPTIELSNTTVDNTYEAGKPFNLTITASESGYTTPSEDPEWQSLFDQLFVVSPFGFWTLLNDNNEATRLQTDAPLGTDPAVIDIPNRANSTWDATTSTTTLPVRYNGLDDVRLIDSVIVDHHFAKQSQDVDNGDCFPDNTSNVLANTASEGDKYGCAIGNSAQNNQNQIYIGRFLPYDFVRTNPDWSTICGNFQYFGMPFDTFSARVEAQTAWGEAITDYSRERSVGFYYIPQFFLEANGDGINILSRLKPDTPDQSDAYNLLGFTNGVLEFPPNTSYHITTDGIGSSQIQHLRFGVRLVPEPSDPSNYPNDFVPYNLPADGTERNQKFFLPGAASCTQTGVSKCSHILLNSSDLLLYEARLQVGSNSPKTRTLGRIPLYIQIKGSNNWFINANDNCTSLPTRAFATVTSATRPDDTLLIGYSNNEAPQFLQPERTINFINGQAEVVFQPETTSRSAYVLPALGNTTNANGCNDIASIALLAGETPWLQSSSLCITGNDPQSNYGLLYWRPTNSESTIRFHIERK